MIDSGVRDKRSRKWKRWERSRPMELRQIDIVGGLPIADGTSAKVDDYSTKRPTTPEMAAQQGDFAEGLADPT
jgi:hypothetical protein